MHYIKITHTPSFTDRQSCVVKVIVLQRLRTIAQIDDYEFRFQNCCVVKCEDRLNEQLSRMQLPDMNSVVAYTKNLVKEKEDNNVGYIIEARVVIMHLQLSDVAKGWYDRGNREEVKTCSVCLKDIENGMEFRRFQCSHMFHGCCVDRWLVKNRSCPNCRYKLKDKMSVEEGLEDMLMLNDYIARLPWKDYYLAHRVNN